ncbi:MAG: hypothetical protein ABIE68_00265 [bacterium]
MDNNNSSINFIEYLIDGWEDINSAGLKKPVLNDDLRNLRVHIEYEGLKKSRKKYHDVWVIDDDMILNDKLEGRFRLIELK